MRRKVTLAVMVAIAISIAAAMVACGGSSEPRVDYSKDPVAVVLMPDGPRSVLTVVDLNTFKVRRRIRLRSLATSIDGDRSSGTVVTAQCGQPHDHDTACGIVNVATGRVSYVDTGLENPDTVVAADGRAFLIHGLQEGRHLLTSVIDLTARRLVANGTVSDRAQSIGLIGGVPVVPVSAVRESDQWPAAAGGLQKIDASGDGDLWLDLPFRSAHVLGESGATAYVIGSLESGDNVHWEICAIDPVTGELRGRQQVNGITRGVVAGCVGEGSVYLCDENGLDVSRPGKNVIALDSETLVEKYRFAVPGSPADVDVWDGRLLVSDGKTGELLLYEKGGAQPVKRVTISKRPLLMADTVVFDGSEGRGVAKR